MTLKASLNPILARETDPAVDLLEALGTAPTVYTTKNEYRREIRKLGSQETAREAIAGLTPDMSIFGFTKGQFSLIDLLKALLDQTGPAHLTLSTWTAANADLQEVLEFLKDGQILSARFLLDFSFQRRQPEVAHMIRERFGMQSLRITKNHAKFVLLRNPQWTLVVKTSMNLNSNPRLEDFDISPDPKLWRFLDGVVTALFKKYHAKDQAKKDSSGHWKEWQELKRQ